MVPFLQAALSLFGMGQYATHHATRAVYATTGVMQVSLLSLGALTFDSEDATFKKIKKSKVKAVATLGAVALSFLGLGCLVELSTGYSQFMGAAITVLGFGGIRNLVLPTMEEYTMEHVISKEPAKIVCQVLHKATSRRFAMKIYDTALMDVHRLNALRVELNTLLPINHPNLINIHDVNVEDGLCYVVCDLEEGDDLFDVLLRKPPLASYGPQVDVWSLGVVAYVLLSGAFPFSGSTQTDLFDAIQVGIIDMPDVSAPAKHFISNMLTVDLTQRYAAPEVVSSQLCVHDSGDDKRHYDKPADVWSVGVVAFVLLCGYLPFHGRSGFDSFRRIKRGKVEFESPYWDHISSDAKAFISSALMVDPTARFERSSIETVQMSVQVSSTKANETCDGVQKKCDTAATVQSA
ncbi:hypothetical protein DYB35_006237 [Aphanomyces astaci]|uniref:Protein kinase domain-containing protein n=1 Tax=Aphanomyces astaci TaxID=112090 RepID=A0A418D6I0_APHAT|nr:hypothetical protein DYB35_006237 [Aphanomyces astaci]